MFVAMWKPITKLEVKKRQNGTKKLKLVQGNTFCYYQPTSNWGTIASQYNNNKQEGATKQTCAFPFKLTTRGILKVGKHELHM
jgi:hypothetical protein